MNVHIEGGLKLGRGLDPTQVDYSDVQVKVAGYDDISPISHNGKSIEFVQEQLIDRVQHRMSALEIKHGMDKLNTVYTMTPHSCLYVFIDADDLEIFTVDDMMKSFPCIASAGALTIDTYVDMLHIPISRKLATNELLDVWGGEKDLHAPSPRVPVFNLDNILSLKRRARDAHYTLVGKAGFDKLVFGMTLKEAFMVTDFQKYGRYTHMR